LEKCCFISPFIEIAEYILELGHHDLAIGIILNFDLPVGTIFTKVAQKMMERQDVQQVKFLLNRGKVIVGRLFNKLIEL
jgi:hypothetical protein